jgi:hypothetical protein
MLPASERHLTSPEVPVPDDLTVMVLRCTSP